MPPPQKPKVDDFDTFDLLNQPDEAFKGTKLNKKGLKATHSEYRKVDSNPFKAKSKGITELKSSNNQSHYIQPTTDVHQTINLEPDVNPSNLHSSSQDPSFPIAQMVKPFEQQN